MKKLFLPLAILIPVICLADRSKESIPEWYAGEQVKDPKLGNSEVVFEMQFTLYDYEPDSVAPLPRIVYAFNGKMDSMDYPKDGKIDIKLQPGCYTGEFYAGPNYFEVKTGPISLEGGNRRQLHINFKSSVHPIMEDKPVIYVYSDQPQPVSIKMQITGRMGFTYPAYNDGWNFIADRDGNLFMNGKAFPYLFWEAQTDIDYTTIDWNNGSIVGRDSLVSFFERSLSDMGMNEKEMTDYITYWVPRMQKNDSCYIHFIMNEDYDEYASMDISPAPDSMFQVFMLWSDAGQIDAGQLTPQYFFPFSRKGLTVVEWGGGELSYLPVIFDARVSN